jgi:hypothetical protein
MELNNNISDRPMTAWNDMMSDNSSSSAETLQIITGDNDVVESSAQCELEPWLGMDPR